MSAVKMQICSTHGNKFQKEFSKLRDMQKTQVFMYLFLFVTGPPHMTALGMFSCACKKKIMGEISKVKQQNAVDTSWKPHEL